MDVAVKHIDAGGSAFPPRPVFADMEPTLEAVEIIGEFLRKNAEDREVKLTELADYKRACLKAAQKCEETLRRYGVES